MDSALKIIFTVLLISELTTEVDTRDLLARSVSQGNETLLSKDIRKLQHQLFTSIKSRTKLLKMAIFQSECTTSGCDFHGIDVNSGLPCNKKILQKLEAIEKNLKNKPKLNKLKPKGCPKKWLRYGPSCLLFVPTMMTWFQGAVLCRSQNAHLVIPDNKKKYEWIVKQARKLALISVWTDGTSLANQDSFVWFSTGKPVLYSDFPKGEPSTKTEQCLHLHKGYNYKWNDYNCLSTSAIACEMSDAQ